MSDLVSRLTAINARTTAVLSRPGINDPRHKQVYLRYPNQADTLIVPNPKVIKASPDRLRAWLDPAVEVLEDMYIVSSVPRSYPEWLMSQAVYVVKGAQANPDGTYSDMLFDAVDLNRTKLVTWEVLIRPYRNR